MRPVTIALFVSILMAAGLSAVHAEEPSDCEPDERTISGNASSPCQWDYHLGEVTTMRYVVMEHPGTDTCYEALEFSPFNFDRDFGPDLYLLASKVRPDGQPDISDYRPATGQIRASDPYRPFVADGNDEALWVRHSLLNQFSSWSNRPREGPYYGLDTSIGTVSKFAFKNRDNVDLPFIKLTTKKEYGDEQYQQTRYFELPVEVNDFNSLMNDCIHGIRLRLESEATEETIRQELGAQERQKQQELEEETAQAEVDALRLASAQAQLLLVQEREVIKTRALKARLERDKVIIEVIQDIALEKLRGAEERGGITHMYLQEIEANYEAFNAEVQGRYDELQRLEAINQSIADAIAAHHATIQDRLLAAEALEQQDVEKLDNLKKEQSRALEEELAPSPSVAKEIEKLAELLDSGLLTQDEFDAQKKELLGQ